MFGLDMWFKRERRVPAEELTEAMLRECPVWEFCNEDGIGETVVRPVKKLPVVDTRGCLLACEFQLADGSRLFGQMRNLSLHDEEKNRHFLSIGVFVHGVLERLALYHEAWYDEQDPGAFAAKLAKRIEDVFPISYDVSSLATGSPACVKGTIPREPARRLSRDALIKLAIE